MSALCDAGSRSGRTDGIRAGHTDIRPADFTNGSIIVGVAGFNGPSAGEPAPFNAFRGSDLVNNDPFTASWTFTYGALSSVASSSITLGIFDHDSQAPGSQVASFFVDGNDLTGLLDAAFEGSGGAQNEYNVYTIALPNSAFASLQDGSTTFSLTLQGPGLPSGLPGNGAGLDFSTLRIDAGAAEVPEPSSLLLTGLGVAGLAGFSLLRRRA